MMFKLYNELFNYIRQLLPEIDIILMIATVFLFPSIILQVYNVMFIFTIFFMFHFL